MYSHNKLFQASTLLIGYFSRVLAYLYLHTKNVLNKKKEGEPDFKRFWMSFDHHREKSLAKEQ